MTELTQIVIALAALISAIVGVLGGNFSALFNLLAPLLQLRSVDFSKLKADILALTPDDRAKLESTFDSNLSISNPALLARITGTANVLDGAVTLGENVVTAALSFYKQGAELVAQFEKLYSLALGKPPGAAAAPMKINIPSWIPIPPWLPKWLVQLVFSTLVYVILPALAVALPTEAPLINDLIALLSGGLASPRLKAAYAHFKAQPAGEHDNPHF